MAVPSGRLFTEVRDGLGGLKSRLQDKRPLERSTGPSLTQWAIPDGTNLTIEIVGVGPDHRVELCGLDYALRPWRSLDLTLRSDRKPRLQHTFRLPIVREPTSLELTVAAPGSAPMPIPVGRAVSRRPTADAVTASAFDGSGHRWGLQAGTLARFEIETVPRLSDPELWADRVLVDYSDVEVLVGGIELPQSLVAVLRSGGGEVSANFINGAARFPLAKMAEIAIGTGQSGDILWNVLGQPGGVQVGWRSADTLRPNSVVRFGGEYVVARGSRVWVRPYWAKSGHLCIKTSVPTPDENGPE